MSNYDEKQQTRGAPPPTTKVDDLARQLAAVTGELEKSAREVEALRAQLAAAADEAAALRARLGDKGKSALPPLPKDAVELGGSMTVPVFDDKLEEVRGDLRPGDVVTTGDAIKLQRELGKSARVFRVTEATVAELRSRDMLR
jgi:hypothetical protein